MVGAVHVFMYTVHVQYMYIVHVYVHDIHTYLQCTCTYNIIHDILYTVTGINNMCAQLCYMLLKSKPHDKAIHMFKFEHVCVARLTPYIYIYMYIHCSMTYEKWF